MRKSPGEIRKIPQVFLFGLLGERTALGLLRVKSLSPLVLLMVALSGCSTLPKFVNEQKPGDAVLRSYNGTMTDAVHGEPVITLKEIDGQAKSVFQKPPVYLRPGKHELGIEIAGLYVAVQREGAQFLQLEFAGVHVYSLKCSSVPPNFVIDFFDETDPTKFVLVSSTKVKGVRAPLLPSVLPD